MAKPVKKNKSETIKELEKLLASSYSLYLKTQNYHWNVVGTMFSQLHSLFEMQYVELAASIDEIAERIRSLGAATPGSFERFAQLSHIKDETGSPDAKKMIKNLVVDQEAIVAVTKVLIKVSEQVDDQATVDLATRRQAAHEKNAWMLRAFLE